MAGLILRVIVSAVLSAILSQALGVAHTDVDMTTEHLYSDGGHRFVYAVLVGPGSVMECQVYGDRNVVKQFNIEPVVVPSDVMRDMIEYCHRTFMDISTVIKHRLKRGFVYPGTKWCGPGDVAKDYEELGRLVETDKCCRTHDHCDDTMAWLEKKHGLRNWSLHRISKCECDYKFYKCLKTADSRASDCVGWLYFDFFNTKCFEKRKVKKCTGWLSTKRCSHKSYETMRFVGAGDWKRR